MSGLQNLRTDGRWFDPLLDHSIPCSTFRSPARQIFSPRFDDSHCVRIYSSFTVVHCFKAGHVGKQSVALKETPRSIDRCTSTAIYLIYSNGDVKHHTIHHSITQKRETRRHFFFYKGANCANTLTVC